MKARRQEGGRVAIWCRACGHGHAVPYEGPNAWTWNGDAEKPTLSPSLLVRGYLNEQHPDGVCHSVVTDGMIAYCGDSTHDLKGQTIALEDF